MSLRGRAEELLMELQALEHEELALEQKRLRLVRSRAQVLRELTAMTAVEAA